MQVTVTNFVDFYRANFQWEQKMQSFQYPTWLHFVPYMPFDLEIIFKVMDDGRMEIISQPFTSLLIIDFARNFKNVKEIAKLIK